MRARIGTFAGAVVATMLASTAHGDDRSRVWLEFTKLAGFKFVSQETSLEGKGQQTIHGRVNGENVVFIVNLMPCKRTHTTSFPTNRTSITRTGCPLNEIAEITKRVDTLQRYLRVRDGRTREHIRNRFNFGATITHGDPECRSGLVGVDREDINFPALVTASACGEAGPLLHDYLAEASLSILGRRAMRAIPK